MSRRLVPRRQPPAYSPLAPSALACGALSILASRPFDRRVRSHFEGAYRPRATLWTDSGTSALRLALEGLRRVRPGPVALPAYSCYDVATAAVGAGAEILFYDVDPESLSPDPTTLAECLAAGARTVVVVHLFGIPVALEGILELAAACEALVLEDAAQGVGATLGGRRLGTIGSIGILSFGRGKGITGGRGGAVLANDEAGEAVLLGVAGSVDGRGRGLANLGRAAVQWALGRPGLYSIPGSMPFLRLGETVYRDPWDPAGLPRSAAGILAVTCSLAETEAAVRRAHAGRLLAGLRDAPGVRTVEPPAGCEPAYLRLPVLLTDRTRGAADLREVRDLGIAPAYPLPLHHLPPLRERRAAPPGGLSGAERLATQLVTLPTHSLLAERDLARLEEWLRRLAV